MELYSGTKEESLFHSWVGLNVGPLIWSVVPHFSTENDSLWVLHTPYILIIDVKHWVAILEDATSISRSCSRCKLLFVISGFWDRYILLINLNPVREAMGVRVTILSDVFYTLHVLDNSHIQVRRLFTSPAERLELCLVHVEIAACQNRVFKRKDGVFIVQFVRL